jgi:hypothetical protein
VIVVETLDRPPVPSWSRRRRGKAQPESPDAGAWLTRVTVVDAAAQLDAGTAEAWLDAAGEAELEAGLVVLNRALRAHRLATADPLVGPLGRSQALIARVGYGTGDELAAGRLSVARVVPWEPASRPRRRIVEPEGRLAALLTGQQRPLVAEELALRARLDLDLSFIRAAALQTVIALDAAIAELAADPAADQLGQEIDGLRRDRDPVAAAAQAALAGEPSPAQMDAVTGALERIEGALRAGSKARR